MQQQELCLNVCGFPVQVYITKLDEGINVLIVGGVKTHVGAVSYAVPGERPVTMQFPGHKDAVVSEKWAKELADMLNSPACVECGIHYDSATKGQIEEIVAACDNLLQETISAL